MPVFNLCLKIIKKNIPVMMIYFGVFIMVSFIMTNMLASSQQAGFSQAKTHMVLIAKEETPLVAGLRDELSKIACFVDIDHDAESLQDALYYRKVNYILRIPKGFTDQFLAGGEPLLEKTVVPNTMDNIYVDMTIDQYLNHARLYVNHIDNIDQNILKANIAESMSKNTRIEIKTGETRNGDQSTAKYYFNFLAYTFMFVVIMGISTIMLVFNNLDIRRRNACAPIEAGRKNLQFILANTLFCLVSWLILVIFCLIFSFRNITDTNIRYYIINSLAFALCISGISFLIGSFMKGREAIAAMANVFTLGTCFISGVFVPQEILSEGVLKVASFLPTYWYVKANDRIAELNVFNGSSLTEVANYILIQLGFALAFFIIALVAGKRKQLSIEEV